MGRLRAVEHGRTVLVAATSGVSAVIAPDGHRSARSDVFTADVLVVRCPVAQGTTLAGRVGAGPEWVVVGDRRWPGWCWRPSRRRRRDARPDRAGDEGERMSVADLGGSWWSSRPTTRPRTWSRRRAGCGPRCPRRTCWSSTTAARTAPASSPTGWPAADPACTCCTGPRRPASARRTSPGSAGRWPTGYDVVVEMDADGSHAPEQLPRLLAALREADLVLGSRWVPGGQVRNWPLLPAAHLASAATTYARVRCGSRCATRPAATGPFRRQVLEELKLRRGRLAGLLLPDRPGLERWRSGFRVARGADHVHRAGGRPEQDEPGRSWARRSGGSPVGADLAQPQRPGRAPGGQAA